MGVVTLVGCDSGWGVELGYCPKNRGIGLALELQCGLNARNVNTSWCLQAKTNTLTAVLSGAGFIYKRCLFSVAGQTPTPARIVFGGARVSGAH